MVNVFNTINKIFDEIKSSVPGIIANNGLIDFEDYSIGYPTNQNKKTCSVRYGEHSNNISNIDFSFIIHLQLPKTLELDVYKYLDSLEEYISELSLDGYIKATYKVILTDDFKNGEPNIYFEVTLFKEVDDCEL